MTGDAAFAPTNTGRKSFTSVPRPGVDSMRAVPPAWVHRP